MALERQLHSLHLLAGGHDDLPGTGRIGTLNKGRDKDDSSDQISRLAACTFQETKIIINLFYKACETQNSSTVIHFHYNFSLFLSGSNIDQLKLKVSAIICLSVNKSNHK